MGTKPINNKNTQLALKSAVIAFLGWMVLASNLLTLSESVVQADNQKLKAESRQEAAKERWLPTEGIAEVAPSNLAVSLPSGCTAFEFAGGATEGFTTQSVSGTQLWHATNASCRAFLPGHSNPYTFYYGQDAVCNYNTGARNAATLISPAISTVATFPPYTVSFNYLLFVEGGGFDTTFVDKSTDGGAIWTQIASKADLVNDNQWHNLVINLTGVGIQPSVRFRFRFDSVDEIANSTTGWHIDDLTLCGQAFNFCVQGDDLNNILQFNSITGAYTFRQCSTGFTRSGTGIVTAMGSTVTLMDNAFDHFVSAIVDDAAHKGSASLKYLTAPRSVLAFNISDSNTLNSNCTCPP